MVDQTFVFPIYRKFEGHLSYFKIHSHTAFTEIKVMGKKLFKYEVTAKTYPDHQLISDMLNCHNQHWQKSKPQEFTRQFALFMSSEN